jgi:uncharacterized protein YdeI (YjbR/CyaY-like superfamily)
MMEFSMPEILSFKTPAAFRRWLARNKDRTEGIWLRSFKKDSGEKTISYREALDEALCYGWIDGQRRSHDAVSYVTKFTPRRSRSMWSKINTAHAERLIQAGRMTAAGLKQVEAAKADGRWQAAYDSPRNATVPDDFLRLLGENKKAKAFFETLNKTNRYSIAYRLQTAKKPETRERRLHQILAMMKRGEKFH